MDIQRIAAFCVGDTGGNPAGVVISESLPSADEMQAVAAKVGYSETAFAAPESEGWRVRYFSPASEVPFCGHATIALGAVLAREFGNGVFSLELNDAVISVEGKADGPHMSAALQSPPTRSHLLPMALIDEVLPIFGYRHDDLDLRLPPAFANAGANHLLFFLNSRRALAAMHYQLAEGKALMEKEKLVTILFGYIESPRRFQTRNAFASGGVLEDPATGAATAALAGYLRDAGWPHEGSIYVRQGEDMGMPSSLHAEISSSKGSSIRVSGDARPI